MDFGKLKARKGKGLESLQKKLEEMDNSGFKNNPLIWKPGFNQSEGTGYAVIRFVPTQHSEDETNIVLLKNHYYTENGMSLGLNCPKTLDFHNKCPVCDNASEMWKSFKANGGSEADKKKVTKRFSKQKYYANVYIVTDRENPDNEGKVLVYQFGPQIKKMIDEAVKPKFEDDVANDPFDMWSGANFKIKSVGKTIPDGKGGKTTVPNYENSSFASVSELFDNDEQKEMVWKQTHDLGEFIKPELIKSDEDIQKIFDQVEKGVTSKSAASKVGTTTAPKVEEKKADKVDSFKEKIQEKKAEEKSVKTEPVTQEESDDELKDFFNSLPQ